MSLYDLYIQVYLTKEIDKNKNLMCHALRKKNTRCPTPFPLRKKTKKISYPQAKIVEFNIVLKVLV